MMKKQTVSKLFAGAFFVLISLAALNNSEMQPNNLIGTWELISFKYTTSDSTMQGDTTQMRSLKVLNGSHFSWITMSSDEKTFLAAGTGTYKFTNNTYTEFTRYSSRPDHINQTYQFTYRIDGDLWYHTGIVNDVKLEEVWHRVK